MSARARYWLSMANAFPYVMQADIEEIRLAVDVLNRHEPSYLMGGSSYAVTMLPWPVLWLSGASVERIGPLFGRRITRTDLLAQSESMRRGAVKAAGRVVEVDEALDFHADELSDVHVQGGEAGDREDPRPDEDE